MNKMLPLAAALALALIPPSAFAQAAQVDLQGEVKLEKTVVENGQSRLALLDPKVVVPGDRLVFSTRYQNKGATSVQNFVVTNPVPAAVTLAPDTAADLDVSADGGKSWGRLAALTVADGKGGRRPARFEDVTHIRWTIPAIAAGGIGKVEYHAIVR